MKASASSSFRPFYIYIFVFVFVAPKVLYTFEFDSLVLVLLTTFALHVSHVCIDNIKTQSSFRFRILKTIVTFMTHCIAIINNCLVHIHGEKIDNRIQEKTQRKLLWNDGFVTFECLVRVCKCRTQFQWSYRCYFELRQLIKMISYISGFCAIFWILS